MVTRSRLSYGFDESPTRQILKPCDDSALCESFYLGPCSHDCSRRRRQEYPRRLGRTARGVRLQVPSVRAPRIISRSTRPRSVRLPDHRPQYEKHNWAPAATDAGRSRSRVTHDLYFGTVRLRSKIEGTSFGGGRLSQQADRRRCSLQAHHFRPQSVLKTARPTIDPGFALLPHFMDSKRN
ncbi:hypothetical protein DEV91_10765 [Phyllobacterium brassicacearum]|nr:hypothetical protein DEV91_10765 [Phyllobacterium brassicacearum]